MKKQFVRRVTIGALALAGVAGTAAVSAPTASAGPAATGKVRICNHARGYSSFIAFTTNTHTRSIAPGHCSTWRPSLKTGKLVYVQGNAQGDVFQIGSYKVPSGTYQVDTRGTRNTATSHINPK